MTVDTISKNKVRICLTEEETITLFGGYDKIDYTDPHSRLTLNMLFREAMPQSSSWLDCERLLIEVKPQLDGCAIDFTRLYGSSGRRYKRIPTNHSYLLSFTSSENLILGICELYRKETTRHIKSDLYSMPEGYRLILFTERTINAELNHLREYCEILLSTVYGIPNTLEYGKPLCLNTAIHTLGKVFYKVK